MFKYLRMRLFYLILKPFSNFTRGSRMRIFVKIIKPVEGMKILDLGGQPTIWDYVETPLAITCLNLTGVAEVNHKTHHKIVYVVGDACNMPNFQFGDFDVVYSNSVIEHVGDANKRMQFANEVRRLANKFWIQTPCKGFPIEAHTGMPFWWYYPSWLREYFIDHWSKKLPGWTDMVVNTTVVSKGELNALFPKAKILTEVIVFPKSYTVYSTDE